LAHPDEDIFDQGLGFDLGTVMDRRHMLRVLGLGAGAVAPARARHGLVGWCRHIGVRDRRRDPVVRVGDPRGDRRAVPWRWIQRA
jgi:hypothetical protein